MACVSNEVSICLGNFLHLFICDNTIHVAFVESNFESISFKNHTHHISVRFIRELYDGTEVCINYVEKADYFCIRR